MRSLEEEIYHYLDKNVSVTYGATNVLYRTHIMWKDHITHKTYYNMHCYQSYFSLTIDILNLLAHVLPNNVTSIIEIADIINDWSEQKLGFVLPI